MFSSEATLAVLILSAVMVVGFVAGSRINRMRARDLANWLRAALRESLGEPQFSQLGAFGFTATTKPSTGPIGHVNVAVVLLPREMLPLWAARSLTRTTDLLTLHIALRRTPAFEGDLVDPRSRVGGQSLRRLPARWTRSAASELVAAGPGEPAVERVNEMAALLTERGIVPLLVSVRRELPHLLVTLPAPRTETATREIISVSGTLAERVSGSESAQAR